MLPLGTAFSTEELCRDALDAHLRGRHRADRHPPLQPEEALLASKAAYHRYMAAVSLELGNTLLIQDEVALPQALMLEVAYGQAPKVAIAVEDVYSHDVQMANTHHKFKHLLVRV